MKKIYILDSNVPLNDYLAMYNFEDNEVIILDVVRKEVASKKNAPGSVGKNSREFTKEIYKLIKSNPSAIQEGIKINIDENDPDKFGILKIHFVDNPKVDNLKIFSMEKDSRDNLILSQAKKIQEQNTDKEVIVVSEDKDFATDVLIEGLRHEEYKHDKIISNIKDIYKGYIYIPIEANEFARLQRLLENENGEKKVFLKDKSHINCEIEVKEIEDSNFLQHEVGAYQKNLISKIKLYYLSLPDYTDATLYPNEFIIFQEAYNGVTTDQELMTFINFSNPKKPFLESLRIGQTVCGLRSKSIREKITNIQQEMLIHLSKTPSVEIVAGLGPAGSGKTLLAVAGACEDAGLSTGYQQVTKGKEPMEMRKIYVSRTYTLLEKDLGALPGDEAEKTEPLFRPIKDNIEVIMKKNHISAENVIENINFLAFTYLQGRSLNDAVVLLDEAQNTHIVDMESFLTRSGDNSRIYLTGDPMQVRKKGVGPLNNGLTQVIELFKGSPFFGTVYMQQAVRSNKAEYATILLNKTE